MNKTGIAWTDYSWNPVTGCTKISPACEHCYAEAVANRFAGGKAFPNGFAVTLHEDRLLQPLSMKKPSRIFVVSMGDLFHEDVPDDYIDRVMDTIWANSRHTFQILTKRPERMLGYLRSHWQRIRLAPQPFSEWALPRNLWVGVTAENQEMADYRIPFLVQIPAQVRFVSVEPMLGPVKLDRWLRIERMTDFPLPSKIVDVPTEIDWVICGCESGPGRRPMQLNWVRDLRDQCHGIATSFFYKQGEVGGKVVECPELDGRQYKEFPQVLEAAS